MENSPRNQSEEDKAAAAKAEALDDDAEDEEKTEEKKQAPRRALGVEIEKIKPEAAQLKPRVSITDRLLERIGAKPEEKRDVAEAESTEEIKAGQDETVTAVTNDEVLLPAAETSDLHDSDSAEAANISHPEIIGADVSEQAVVLVPETAVEAADWESEDASSGTEVAPEHHSSGEVAPETEEDHEVFAEIPPSPRLETEPVVAELEPELLEDGLESEGPPEPPEDAVPFAARSGSGGGGSGGTYGGSGGSSSAAERPWYDAAAADRVREQELNDAEYRGQKTGLRHGLAAGLTFGWLFGRHGKKKQAKAFTKELKSKDTEIKALKNEQYTTSTHLEAVKRTQEQLSSHIQKQGSKPAAALENVPQRQPEAMNTSQITRKTIEKQVINKTVEVTPVVLKQPAEVLYKSEKVAHIMEAAAASAALTAVERSASHISKTEQRIRPESTETIKIVPEHQELTEETYQVAEGRHVETSAWHRIEIDEKTGKPAQNPEVAYGEEFRREQKQEVFSDDTSDDSKEAPAKAQKQSGRSTQQDAHQHVAQIGGLAAASYTKEDQTYSETKPRETGLGGMPSRSNKEQSTAKNSILHYASMPIIWAIAVVIVVVLFVLGALS